MTQTDPQRLADAYEWRELARQAGPLMAQARSILLAEGRVKAANRLKTAGEVIFRKDRGDDKEQWAFNDIAPWRSSSIFPV